MQSLYEWDFWGRDDSKLKGIVDANIKEFGPGLENSDFVWELIHNVMERLDKINEIIEKALDIIHKEAGDKLTK